MGRLLAIDYGTRRTGIAVSDPLQIIATPLCTIPTAQLVEFLCDYVQSNGVQTVVVGQPSQMNGAPSQTMKQIGPLVEKLRRMLSPVPVEYYDERFTSVLAHRAMLDGGVKKQDRRDKAMVDRISAAIILQGYMDSRKK